MIDRSDFDVFWLVFASMIVSGTLATVLFLLTRDLSSDLRIRRVIRWICTIWLAPPFLYLALAIFLLLIPGANAGVGSIGSGYLLLVLPTLALTPLPVLIASYAVPAGLRSLPWWSPKARWRLVGIIIVATIWLPSLAYFLVTRTQLLLKLI